MIKSVLKNLIIVLSAVILVGCEYLPISGGQLKGTVAPLPDDLSGIAAVDIIQLESNPAEPYSVNLWIVEVDGGLHVFAGDNRSAWVENIAADPSVRLGVNGSLYEMTATRITSAEVMERFAAEWDAKYGNRPRNENIEETYLYRLSARTP